MVNVGSRQHKPSEDAERPRAAEVLKQLRVKLAEVPDLAEAAAVSHFDCESDAALGRYLEVVFGEFIRK